MTNSTSRPTRRNALGMIGATFVLPQIAQAAATQSIEGAAFGTTWQLVASHHDDLERLRADIDALFAIIDQQMSPWRSDSDISRFNTMGAGRHRADPEMILVTTAALDLAKASHGAFDPTVGPVVGRWGFGPILGSPTADWRGLSLGSGDIGKTHDDLTLDLCGIAKGRALDLAVDLVKARGVDNFLFDVGGELKAVGQHPAGRSFQVAVQHPAARPSAGSFPQRKGATMFALLARQHCGAIARCRWPTISSARAAALCVPSHPAGCSRRLFARSFLIYPKIIHRPFGLAISCKSPHQPMSSTLHPWT